MSKAGDAAKGALSGAATGATIGSIVPGYGTVIGAGVGAVAGGLAGYFSGDDGPSADDIRKQKLNQQALLAGRFANDAQRNYTEQTARGYQALGALQRQASGQDSISAEQLRQGLQQNLAAQRSLAAGASPRNSALAARTAAIQSGRLGAGLAGQQALAGLQERQQAQQQYAQLLQGLRAQDLNATLTSRGTALGGYGAANAGPPPKSFIEEYGPAIQGVASAYAASKSDRRAKTDIKDGSESANAAIRGLASYTYKYKDERDGKGTRLGIMAQDLEKAGLRHAVIDTPSGKMVHGAHLATANTAMIAALGRRVAELEGGKGR